MIIDYQLGTLFMRRVQIYHHMLAHHCLVMKMRTKWLLMNWSLVFAFIQSKIRTINTNLIIIYLTPILNILKALLSIGLRIIVYFFSQGLIVINLVTI